MNFKGSLGIVLFLAALQCQGAGYPESTVRIVAPFTPGGVTDVLINQAGFNIFRVTERKAEREYALEEIKDDLPAAVGDIQFREKLDEWVKGLRAKAHIQINKS